MKVLITGAAGFLGRHFLAHHRLLDDTVWAFDDMSASHAEWSEGIIREDAAVAFAELWDERFDLAYHFAAPVGGREMIEGDPMYNARSLELDSAFFRWAIGHTEVAVYPSSSAVYGAILQRKDAGQLHEGRFNAADPSWLAPDELYGFTKLAGEMLAWKATRYGLNTLCIRPFSGYGEGQPDSYPVTAICQRAIAREDPLVIWGSGQQKRDLIHVSDIVGATTSRLRAPLTGYETMNIGRGIGITFESVAAMAASIIGYHPKIVTDESKPEGVINRRADPTRMSYFHEPAINLRSGLERVIRWLEATS